MVCPQCITQPVQAASPAGPGAVCYFERMAADSKTLTGRLPGHDARWVIATVLTVGGLLLMNMNSRLDDLRADVTNQISTLAGQLAELRTDLRRIDDRLRAVEIALKPALSTPDR